ncbi:MAG: 50S ribosomal protein L2 [Alphaproteobacteria bacterium]
MTLRKFRPITPSTRTLVLVDKSELWKGSPVKSLTHGASRTGGRNNHGRITAAHRGGGTRRRLRKVDFRRKRFGAEARVERLEYDPGRTAFIALIRYGDGELSYILAPQGLSAGDTVISDDRTPVRVGNSMPLLNIPEGTTVHNVELKPGAGGQLARAAGSSAQYLGLDRDYALLRLASGEVRRVRGECRATIGVVSNSDHMNESYGKAGRMRWRGRRPHVRGVAMNPVDHPHGGGEGKTSGGRHPVNARGLPTKGYKTRSKRRSNAMIVRRRKGGRRRR